MTEDQMKNCKIDVPEEIENAPAPINEQQAEKIASDSENSKPESCKIEVPDKVKALNNQKQVYQWAASNIGESIQGNDKFFKNHIYNSLLYRIQNTNGGLTMIQGNQGIGKTRTMVELSRETKDNLRIKWARNWKEDLSQQEQRFTSRYEELVEKEFANQIAGLTASGQTAKLRRIGKTETYQERQDHRAMEEIIGKSRCKELKEQALTDFLASIRVFLVDMPDYAKSNVAAMNNDISLIQEFYQSLSNKGATHLVIAAQKELIMNSDHFFWGKFTKYALEPLSTMQLKDAYKLNNPDTEVFDQDALNFIAEVSRGVFRRFKKYVCSVIENNRNQTQPINESQVRSAVTDDVIFEDLEAELSNLFDDQERKRCTSAILSYLRDHKDVNIKTIATDTGVSQTMAQKIVAKLELYKYITTEHGTGKEKLVSLRPYMPVPPFTFSCNEPFDPNDTRSDLHKEVDREIAKRQALDRWVKDGGQ
jgi:hypothetical protein